LVESMIDGRNARGLRTRGEIIAALLELVREGDVSPTMQSIADRAGVSVRSIYQHFTDTEGLYREVGEEIITWVTERAVEVNPSAPLAARIEEFVSGRSQNLESLSNVSRAASLIEHNSPALQEIRATINGLARDRVADSFAPELAKLNKQSANVVLDALDVWCSLAAWDHLRAGGHSIASARKVTVKGLHLIFAGSKL
jgi:TetR/AcrR family transcriptional regulator, regulator of autoinduction and epiphytic fitness